MAIDDSIEDEEEEDEDDDEDDDEQTYSKKRSHGKRKRKDDEDVIPVLETSRKRRGRPPMDKLSTLPSRKTKKLMKKLISTCIKYTNSEGRILSEPFMKLPSRRELPDYYEVIKKPVDFKKILQKIEDSKYNTIDDLERDFTQMCRNAQKYNKETSLIHEDSIQLKKVFINARIKHEQEIVSLKDFDGDEDEEADDCQGMVRMLVDDEEMQSDSDSMKVRIKLSRKVVSGCSSNTTGRRGTKRLQRRISKKEECFNKEMSEED